MLIRRLPSSLGLLQKSLASFSAGHHAKPFDWRDDHTLNTSYERDPRKIGIPDPRQYTYPFTAAHPDPVMEDFPPEYNPKNLNQNWIGPYVDDGRVITNYLDAPEQIPMHQVQHEFEYESEDFDFQPESFETQHFRKKGFITGWVIMCSSCVWLIYNEFVYLAPFGTEVFRYQRPPPLNYPDEEDTPDTEAAEMFKTKEHQYLWDAGLLKDPFMDIIDGKKVYSKWAGVNDPHVAIYKDW